MRELFEILNENIKKHDEIIIMTHARPDLDGMGSALAFYCKRKEGKPLIFCKTQFFHTHHFIKNNIITYII